jgi:hypothetical protein
MTSSSATELSVILPRVAGEGAHAEHGGGGAGATMSLATNPRKIEERLEW